MIDSIVCPECRGTKEVGVLVCPGGIFKMIDCRMCNGSGEITPEHQARIEAGKKLRADRIARGLSLREEASRLGIDPIDLSHKENGRV